MVVIYDDDESEGDPDSDNVVEHENKQPVGKVIASAATLAYREEQDNELKESLDKSVQTISEGEFLKLLDLLSTGR